MRPSNILRIIGGALALAVLPVAQAAEERVWVTRKGEHHTAQLLRVEGSNAVLVTPAPKELRVKIEDLSLVDRLYVVEYGGADAKLINSSCQHRNSCFW